MKRPVLLALASGLAIAAATPASAGIFIAYSVNGGAITQLASDAATPGSAGYVGNTNGYFFNLGATGSPILQQPNLATQAIAVQNAMQTTGNVVSIYITNTDLNSFNGGLLSSFTSNVLSGSAQSVTMSSYYSAANQLYGGTLMRSATFTGLGVAESGPSINVAGPFSTTIRYDLTFGAGMGTFNDTANLTAVPEPATWAMMIFGFGLMGATLRSRKTNVAFT